jgi:CheY-like chemotaxis protein
MEYDLPSLINDTVIQNVIRAGSKPVQFNLRVDENLPLKLIGDELRIKQIFNNLLSNAFKYTDQGSVDWDISAETGEEGIWLVSSVRDTGIGIRREDMDKLFTNYNQVDIKSNRRIEGTGLGLSITKNLVELMGGGIAVKSEYGEGSVFSIRIRQEYSGGEAIGRDTAESLAAFQYTASRRSRNEKLARVWIPYASVLVVDDVSANLDVARGMMKPYGMTVDCVMSGQKAIDLIREGKKYSAIFMDHMMPGMDGIEAARIIRTGIGTEYAKTVPLIALTANAIIGAEELFLGSGFQAFLSKPIDIISLDRVINRFVRDKKREAEGGLTGRKNGAEGPENKAGVLAGRFVEGIDFDTGLNRFDYNEEVYLQVLSSYLFQLASMTGKIRLNPGEKPREYKIAVHSLKSTSYSIGARQIGRMAEELEQAVSTGDMEFISAHNGALAAALEKLIPSLEAFLKEVHEFNQPPPLPGPDPVLLGRLLDACADYDMAKLDAAMDELGKYRYESQEDLIAWLREQAGRSELEKIRDRLSGMGVKGGNGG